jgi:hypothetical protein
MPLIYNKALNLTDVEIRYAMSNSRSNREAARFLGCHLSTYKRYALRYIDHETGLTLWELHKNPAGKNLTKHFKTHPKRINIFDVLEGKHPTYNTRKLHTRLVEECIFPEECAICGFGEHRITDDKVPLVLVWKDGNKTNHVKDNLEFVCYNCYFLMYGDLFSESGRLKMNIHTDV